MPIYPQPKPTLDLPAYLSIPVHYYPDKFRLPGLAPELWLKIIKTSDQLMMKEYDSAKKELPKWEKYTRLSRQRCLKLERELAGLLRAYDPAARPLARQSDVKIEFVESDLSHWQWKHKLFLDNFNTTRETVETLGSKKLLDTQLLIEELDEGNEERLACGLKRRRLTEAEQLVLDKTVADLVLEEF